MSYNISSESFKNPLLKELLEKLTEYFASIDAEFYVIGATARDIIFSGIHNQVPIRTTDDLDIAIAIPDWSKFDEIVQGLCKIDGFVKSKEQKQRVLFKGVFKLDIIPFGEIAKADGNIYWPSEESFAMSVSGFTEVAKHSLEIIIDNKFTIYVANLPGIFLLKLLAWRDRHLETKKDADDMAFIISNYLDINDERAATEHYDLYEPDNFSTIIAGASLLGRDMKVILNTNQESLKEFIALLNREIEKEEESQLINDIMETHPSLKYEDVFESLFALTIELSK
jgi:predicted nucleotidyltransferase